MTKERNVWSGFGVPLAWLAGLDCIPADNALAGAFGDRYLYRYCPVFRSIRDAVLRLGFSFSALDSPSWRDYQSFPLMSLPRILADKSIPFFDTATTFDRLVQQYPAARLPPGFVAGNLKANHVFHESAHCVAAAILRELPVTLTQPGARAAGETILAESFANTVEALGSVFIYMPLSDKVFYRLNSYFQPNEKPLEVMIRAEELGAERRFVVLLLSYFEANLSAEPPTEKTFEQIAEAGGCASAEYGLARELTDVAFTLKRGFRENTNPVYFDLVGMGEEYRALASADWLGRQENQGFAREVSRRFWEAAGKP